MKTLLLMRHGKAGWKKGEEDKTRSLSKRGVKDSHKMGELLAEKGLVPQVILTSTALRARETAKVFLEQCCDEVTFIALGALYMAEPSAIIETLKSVPEQAERAMVIGHNPGLESVLQILSGKVESLPTASIACLELPVEHWADISLSTQVKKWEKWKPKDA